MKRKFYTPEFKQEIVSRIQRGESVNALRKETGISAGTLHSWKNTIDLSDNNNNNNNNRVERSTNTDNTFTNMNTELLNLAIEQLNTRAIAGVSVTRTGMSVHFALPTTQENF